MVDIEKTLKEELEEINAEYVSDDNFREEIIKQARDILKNSKKAIYSTHRGKLEEAKKRLLLAETKIIEVQELLDKSNFENIGSFKAGLEEYVEAKFFTTYVSKRELITKKTIEEELKNKVKIPNSTFLGGLSDFTGELVRRAVLLATEQEYDEVKQILSIVQEIYGLLIEFDFRNGETRKKFDNIKYNLSKLESITYDLSLRK
jgi:predicted translin family RNA/ssDNA-binding protein